MPESENNKTDNLPVPVTKQKEFDFNLEDKPLTTEEAYEKALKGEDDSTPITPDINPSTEAPKAPETLESKVDDNKAQPIEPPKGCWYKIKKAGVYALFGLALGSLVYGSCTDFKDCRHAGNYLADNLVFSKQEQKVDNKKTEPEAPMPAQGLTPSITSNYPAPVQGPMQPVQGPVQQKLSQPQEKPKQEVKKQKIIKSKDGYIFRHNNPTYKHERGIADISCINNGYAVEINENLSKSKFTGLEAVLIDMNTLNVLEETKQVIKDNKAYISLANYSGNDNLRVGIIGYDNEGNKYVLSSVGKNDKLTSSSICKTKQETKKETSKKVVEPVIQKEEFKNEPVLGPEQEFRRQQAEQSKKPVENLIVTQKSSADISPFIIQYFDSNKIEFNLNDDGDFGSLYDEIRDNKFNRNEYMNANSTHYVKVSDSNLELEITSKFDKNGKPIRFKSLKKDKDGFYPFNINKQPDTVIRATAADGDLNYYLWLTNKTTDLSGDNVVLASGLSSIKLSASNSEINNFKKRHPQYNIKFLKADPHHAKEIVTVIYHDSNGKVIGKDSIEYIVGQDISKLNTIKVNLAERSCESTEEYEAHSIKENRKVKCQWNCTGETQNQNNNYVVPQNLPKKQTPQTDKYIQQPNQNTNSTNPLVQEEASKKKSTKVNSAKETPRVGISAAGLFINGTANIKENNGSDNYKISGWETRLDGEAKFTENSSLVAQFTYGQQDESSDNVKIRKKPFSVGGFYKGEFVNALEGTDVFAGYIYKENPLDIQVYDQKITQKVNTNEIVGYVDAQVVDVGLGTVGAYAGVVYDDTNITQKDEMYNETYNKKISQFNTIAGLSSEFDSGIKSSLGWEQYTENVDYTNNKVLTGNNLTGTFEWETSKNILRAYGSYPISGQLQKTTIGIDDTFSVLPDWYIKILANWEKYQWDYPTTNTNYNKENFEIGAAIVYGIPDITTNIERLLHK